MFWEVISGFNDEQRRKYLIFATASTRLPSANFAKHEHELIEEEDKTTTIKRENGESYERKSKKWAKDSMPEAHTCTLTLHTPLYTDASRLRERLIEAMESGSGISD